VFNFFLLYARVDIGIWVPEANSQKRAYILHALYKNFENLEARTGILFGDVNGSSGVTRGLSLGEGQT